MPTMSKPGVTDEEYNDLYQRSIRDPMPRREDGQIDAHKAASDLIELAEAYLIRERPDMEIKAVAGDNGEPVILEDEERDELLEEVSRICAALLAKSDALAASAEEPKQEEEQDNDDEDDDEGLDPAFATNLSVDDFPGDPPSRKLLDFIKEYCKEHNRIYDETRVILAFKSWSKKPDKLFWGLRERILAGEPGLPETLQKLVRKPAKKNGNYIRMGSEPRKVSEYAEFFQKRPRSTINAWYFEKFQGNVDEDAEFWPCYAGETASKTANLVQRLRTDMVSSMVSYVESKLGWNDPKRTRNLRKYDNNVLSTLIMRFHLFEAELAELPRVDAPGNAAQLLRDSWTLVSGPSKTGDPLVDDYQEIISICFAGGLNKRFGGKMALVKLPIDIRRRMRSVNDICALLNFVGDTPSEKGLVNLQRRVSYACFMLGIPEIHLDFDTNMMDVYPEGYVCNDKRLHVEKVRDSGGALGKRPASFPHASDDVTDLFLSRCEDQPVVLALGTAAYTSLIQILEPRAKEPIQTHGMLRGHTQGTIGIGIAGSSLKPAAVIELRDGGRIQLTFLNNPGSIGYARDVTLAATELAYYIGNAIDDGQAFLKYPNIVEAFEQLEI